MEKETVLITGASSGIGKEFAKIFAQNNYNLILHGRDKESLQSLKNQLQHNFQANAQLIIADLVKPNAVKNIFDMLKQKEIKINVLINNAGFGNHGAFKETNLQEETDMIAVNITALTQLTKYAIEQMDNKGMILNIASTAAFQPGPYMAVYFATKSYVLSFSEAIAAELEGTGIQVSVLCPGPTQSNFAKRAKMEGQGNFKGDIPTARAVAEYGFKEFMEGKTLIIHGSKNKLLATATRFIPRKNVVNMLKNMQKPKDI